jgi:ABC-type branched-subunit amino acid transport system substrate-binding protein
VLKPESQIRLIAHCRCIAACGALLLSLSTSGCWVEEPGPIEVAIAVPYPSGELMREARRAWELALEQINLAGGVDGRTLNVHERDLSLGKGNGPRRIADGLSSLTRDGYEYIISLVSGSALSAMMDAATPHGVLAMSVTSEDPASELPDFDGALLRAILPTDQLILKQALALQAEGLESVAIVGETVGGQQDVRELAMHEAYAGCDSCTTTTITYPIEADLYRYDWESVGQAVMAGKPDVVYLASADVSALLDTLFWVERAGYTGRYYFAHGSVMANLVAAMPGSKVPERFRSHDLALPPSERLDRFLATYRDRYGDSFIPEPRLIAFADYLALLALAMTRVGSADPRAVAATMKELAAPPGEPYGTLEFMDAAAAVRAGQDIDFVGLSEHWISTRAARSPTVSSKSTG